MPAADRVTLCHAWVSRLGGGPTGLWPPLQPGGGRTHQERDSDHSQPVDFLDESIRHHPFPQRRVPAGLGRLVVGAGVLWASTAAAGPGGPIFSRFHLRLHGLVSPCGARVIRASAPLPDQHQRQPQQKDHGRHDHRGEAHASEGLALNVGDAEEEAVCRRTPGLVES